MKGRRARLFAVLCAWLTAVGAPAPALGDDAWYAGTLEVSAGGDWSTGRYGGDTNTDLLYLPFSLRYRWEEFPTPYVWDELELAVTAAYVRLDGPAVLIDGTPAASPLLESQVRDGLGDVLVRTTYRIFAPREWSLPALELGARVKVPTADRSKGLGTGELDTTVFVGLADRFGDLSVFGTVGYRFAGDPPGVDLRDTLETTLGTSLRLADRYGVGLSYDWRDARFRGARDAHELVPFAWLQVRRAWRITPYAVVGLSEGSPDVGVGLQVTVSVPVR